MWKVIFIVTIVLSAALTLYLPLSSPAGIFNTPDENANHFFAELLARRGELRAEEPLNALVDNAVHPRGVNVIRGFLVPESFLGLPILYGVTKVVGQSAWPPAVFTVIITLFALFALYSLFLHFFNTRVSKLALLLILALPVFLYWAGRPYMHTILFLDFLVLGWCLIVRMSKRWDVVAGILLGLVLAMRASEVVWIGVGTLLLLLPLRIRGSQRGLRTDHNSPQPPLNLRGGELLAIRLFKLTAGAALVLVPLLFLNQDLYGSVFGTGYSVTESNLIREDGAVPQLARTSFVSQLLFPFGFHPISALSRFVRYALGGMWWYVAPIILGVFVQGLARFRKVEQGRAGGEKSTPLHPAQPRYTLLNPFIYSLVWFFISLYLIFVYGSFRAEVFADPMHPLGATIGAPYLRYWLPIFVFGAPMAAEFLVFIYSVILRPKAEGSPTNVGVRSRIRAGFLAPLGMTLGVVLAVSLSTRATIWSGPESLLAIRENLWQFAEVRERTVRATPEDAVFIVPRWADRIYFPARRVITDVDGKDVVDIINTLQNEGISIFWHRGRGEIKLEPEIYDAGFTLKRRFDIDLKGKVYEIVE